MDLDFVSVHKDAKRERGQYPAILTELAWSIKDLLYGIKSTEKMIFVLVYFRPLKRKPVIRKSDNAFRFSCFLVPSRQRNHRKSYYCHGKIFANGNFHTPAWTSAKCYCGKKTGNRERAVSLHLARSGSQSQRGVWFILPAPEACHIIICTYWLNRRAGRENIWSEVMAYGPSAARSVRHDWGPIFFPSGPT